MDKIYLVKNTQDEYDNGAILSICATEETANKVAERVKENFKEIREDEEIDFIVVEAVEIRADVDVSWDMYPEDHEPNFTYAE